MELLIFEGARGTGKSTLTFKMRQKLKESTLINPTGFHTDGIEGLDKTSKYYDSWMRFLIDMSNHDSTFIFDRFYFSERVYSSLYKEYDFTDKYNSLNEYLEDLSHMGVKIKIFLLTIEDKDELRGRLIRDKIPFGKAEESVEQTLQQQDVYKKIFDSIDYNYGSDNLKVYKVDTSGKTSDDVYVEVLKNLKPLN